MRGRRNIHSLLLCSALLDATDAGTHPSSKRFTPHRAGFGAACTFPADAACPGSAQAVKHHPHGAADAPLASSVDVLLGMCKLASARPPPTDATILSRYHPKKRRICADCEHSTTCSPFSLCSPCVWVVNVADASWNSCGPPIRPARHNTFVEVARLVHSSTRWKEGYSLGWFPNRTGNAHSIPCARPLSLLHPNLWTAPMCFTVTTGDVCIVRRHSEALLKHC